MNNNIDVDFIDIFYRIGYDLNTNLLNNKMVLELDKLQENISETDYCMVEYVEEDKMVLKKYDIDNNVNNNFINTVIFNINIYIDEILKSYKYNPKNIWDQFNVDMPRVNIYINNEKITSKDYFCKLLNDYKNRYICKNCIKFDQLAILAMICNQSSYAFPYIYLYGLLNDELNNLCCLNTNRNIRFNLKSTYKYITLEADFAIKQIDNSDFILKNTIKMKLTININNNENLFDNYGLFEWSII